MNIYSLNSYTPNVYPRRNMGYTAVSQVNFHGDKRLNTKVLNKDVVSITKKFEELSPKEQRQTLFLTFNNSSHFSIETLRNLMKFKDKSIPLLNELYELTKNDDYFTGSLPFVDLKEEDLPARIEFYKKYKEANAETIWDDVALLSSINRYNLPLAKLIGVKSHYNGEEIDLIKNTLTKEDADARIEAWKLVSELEELSHGEEYVCTKRWLKGDKLNIISHTNKDNLPLLRKFRDHYEAYSNVPDAINNVMLGTNKDNVKYKLKIFDAMEDFGIENDDVDILECTDNKNYPLVEYLLKDEIFLGIVFQRLQMISKRKTANRKLKYMKVLINPKKLILIGFRLQI